MLITNMMNTQMNNKDGSKLILARMEKVMILMEEVKTPGVLVMEDLEVGDDNYI
jgi:hypothetical protein